MPRSHCGFWVSTSASNLCIRAPRGGYTYSSGRTRRVDWGPTEGLISRTEARMLLLCSKGCESIRVKSNDDGECGSSGERDACWETDRSILENGGQRRLRCSNEKVSWTNSHFYVLKSNLINACLKILHFHTCALCLLG